MQLSQVFLRKLKLITNAIIESDPVDVPNTRPLDIKCALYKPARAARDAMAARAVRMTDIHSQRAQAAEDFFLEDLNIVEKGKRMKLYAVLYQVNNFIRVKRVDGCSNARSKMQTVRSKEISRSNVKTGYAFLNMGI